MAFKPLKVKVRKTKTGYIIVVSILILAVMACMYQISHAPTLADINLELE